MKTFNCKCCNKELIPKSIIDLDEVKELKCYTFLCKNCKDLRVDCEYHFINDTFFAQFFWSHKYKIHVRMQINCGYIPGDISVFNCIDYNGKLERDVHILNIKNTTDISVDNVDQKIKTILAFQ